MGRPNVELTITFLSVFNSIAIFLARRCDSSCDVENGIYSVYKLMHYLAYKTLGLNFAKITRHDRIKQEACEHVSEWSQRDMMKEQ